MKESARYLLASSPTVIYTCAAENGYVTTYVSDNVAGLLGHAPEKFVADPNFWREHIHPDDRERVLAGVASGSRAGQHSHEYRFRAANGEYRWLRDVFRLVGDTAAGKGELVGSWLDITDRKLLEENYRYFATLTSDYLHRCSRSGSAPFRLQWLEGAVGPISGYTLTELLALGCWLPLVHPEDRERVAAYLLQLVPDTSGSIEFRIVTKDRQIRWVSEKSHCVAGLRPGELVLYGAVTDITEFKLLEVKREELLKELRDSREMLSTILDTIPQSVFWKDADSRYLGCNRHFAAAAGLESPDRIVGLSDYDLPWPRGEADAYRADDRQVLADNAGKFHIIEPLQLADGRRIWIDTSKTPLRGTDGQPFGVLGIFEDITERKRIEEALKLSEAQLNEAEALAHIGSWQLNLQTNELRWSEEIYQLFEIDQRTFPASYEAFLAVVHPDDRARVDRAYSDSVKNHAPYEIVHRLLMKDGRIKFVQERCQTWYDPSGTPIRSVGTVQDITERLRVEEALRESRDRLAQLAEQSRTIIWEVDAQGVYTYVSPVCEKVIGYRPEELVGRMHFYDLHADDGREDFKAAALAAIVNRELLFNLVKVAPAKNGKLVWLSTNGMPLVDADGTLRGYRGSDMDITVQKELEYQNMRAAQLAAVGELASGIAHEINNPITGIINYAQLLLNQAHLAERDREILGRIVKEGDRIALIVRDLLYFARDGGKQKSVVAAQQLLEEALMLARKQLEKDGVELLLDVPEQPLDIYVNPQQVEQVWLNLVSNARHALTERAAAVPAPKELRITMQQVALQGRPFCRTTFRDNGTGIPNHLLANIFRPFFTTKPAGVGTGLGLSISLGIVKSFGGELTVTSQEGEFTEVTVDLPLAAG